MSCMYNIISNFPSSGSGYNHHYTYNLLQTVESKWVLFGINKITYNCNFPLSAPKVEKLVFVMSIANTQIFFNSYASIKKNINQPWITNFPCFNTHILVLVLFMDFFHHFRLSYTCVDFV